VKKVSEEETNLNKITDEDIIATIDKANKEAVNAMRELGISFTNPGNYFKTFGCI